MSKGILMFAHNNSEIDYFRMAFVNAMLVKKHLGADVTVVTDQHSYDYVLETVPEDKIQKAISHAAERQTTILITHRLSQIRWADLVIVLRKGEIIAVGQHEQLMDDVPAYRRIFEQYN